MSTPGPRSSYTLPNVTLTPAAIRFEDVCHAGVRALSDEFKCQKQAAMAHAMPFWAP